ncbi:unnamed protein product, partial [Aureobasidium vineae]
MQQPTLSSRIRESAAGLTKDILSNNGGHGALETTNQLATLRSAHKLSSTTSRGTSSSTHLPRLLSYREHTVNGSLRDTPLHFGLNTATDVDAELSGFLLQECNMKDASASSSRSGSTLNLSLVNGDDNEPWQRDQLRRNDSFEPELSRSKQKSPAELRYSADELSQQSIDREDSEHHSIDWDGHLEQSFSKANEVNFQELSTRQHISANTIRNTYHTESQRRKERALSRLHLIFSQMPAVTQPQNTAGQRQADSLESSYNQLCGGEDAQEWAEFEASLFRTYSGQTQALGQDLLQRQHHEQDSAMITGRQAPIGDSLHENHMLQRLEPSREALLQQKQALTNKGGEQSKNEESMVEFHCPWIDCNSMCADYIRNTDDPDSLPCAHTGCELEFATEEVWRKHVSIAHHNLLPRPQPTGEIDMEAAWEKIQA